MRSVEELFAAAWPGGHDVASTAALKSAGIDDRLLAKAVRSGLVLRLRQGAYIPVHRWDPLTRWEREIARLDAHVEGTHGSAVYCLASAAVLRGCAVWNVGSAIHVATSYAGSRASRSKDTATHQLALAENDVGRDLRAGGGGPSRWWTRLSARPSPWGRAGLGFCSNAWGSNGLRCSSSCRRRLANPCSWNWAGCSYAFAGQTWSARTRCDDASSLRFERLRDGRLDAEIERR